MNVTNILLRHNYIPMPESDGETGQEALATVMMNLSYYGFALNVDAYKALTKLSPTTLAGWWNEVETELKDITGAGRKIGDFVVYKNFPAEVLNKSEAQYWFAQILMYWGLPNELFTEEVVPREKMDEQKKAIVLKRAGKDSLKGIFNSLLQSPARWKKEELATVLFLTDCMPVNLGKPMFKENLVHLVAHMMESGKEVQIKTATDVLRLAAGLSDGDVSLREKVKFKSFKNKERRFLVSTLESCENLSEDVARRPELWKRLFRQLHPGDFKKSCPNVCAVRDNLYNDRLETFNSSVEKLLVAKDKSVLDLLATRPGDFKRRLVHAVELFGNTAISAFTSEAVLSKLTTAQVVSLRSYLKTVNSRFNRVFPPRGNWAKVQVADARRVDEKYVKSLMKSLGDVLTARVPKIRFLDAATSRVKLPSNDGEVSPYARGTTFPIPDDVEFIRTASYWEKKEVGNVWFDNGWNFFDEDWNPVGSCTWTEVNYRSSSAVFSGDPTNSKEMKGRACQLIDLYPKKLVSSGVRYAVWSVLCFSRIPFAKATDVFAALQWGKDPQKGNLFEPSRCQLAFPLTGESLAKYVCLIDLEKREMVYLDANLGGVVNTATSNAKHLEKLMPPFMEYVGALPSVQDLFRESVDKKAKTVVLYSDKDTKLNGEPAYVFKPENKENKFLSVDLNSILT